MNNGNRSPDRDRTALRVRSLKSPTLRSLPLLAVAGVSLALPLRFGVASNGDLSLGLFALAALAAFGVVLVLVQSTGFSQIRKLRMNSKHQRDEIARATFYRDQITEALLEVSQFRRATGPMDAIDLANRILMATAKRAAVFDSSACLYLVETTPQWHIVRATGGTTRFEIEPGKKCRGDRSLEEALGGIGNYWYTAPLKMKGIDHSLVLLADSPPTGPDCILIDQLAMALGFAEAPIAKRARTTRRSNADLRAV